jgi:hypothetical protein
LSERWFYGGGAGARAGRRQELLPVSVRVWNYTSRKARPIEYGVGEFRDSEIDGRSTHVVWTYSFKLKDHQFPGYLGALGRYLFRVRFLDSQYAAMMRGTLEAGKATAEKEPAGNNR